MKKLTEKYWKNWQEFWLKNKTNLFETFTAKLVTSHQEIQ